jgi:hypothetical protein
VDDPEEEDSETQEGNWVDQAYPKRRALEERDDNVAVDQVAKRMRVK